MVVVVAAAVPIRTWVLVVLDEYRTPRVEGAARRTTLYPGLVDQTTRARESLEGKVGLCPRKKIWCESRATNHSGLVVEQAVEEEAAAGEREGEATVKVDGGHEGAVVPGISLYHQDLLCIISKISRISIEQRRRRKQ